MSPKPPRAKAREVLRALHRAGWVEREKHGSHLQLTNPTRPGRVTVPIHTGKTPPPAVMKSILDGAGLTIEEFLRLL